MNGVRYIPRAGIVIDSSRTLSTDPRWYYVNVRLLFNFVKSSLKDGLRWVRQEPNRQALWNAIKFNAVTPFLLGRRQGAFGTGSPEEVFTVICAASNNPPDQVDQGVLNVEVYFYPSRPAETIVINSRPARLGRNRVRSLINPPQGEASCQKSEISGRTARMNSCLSSTGAKALA